MTNTTTTIDQDQPTLWPMAHAFVGKSHPDSIPVNPTRIASGAAGREKRFQADQWKVFRPTRKTNKVRRKAAKWTAINAALASGAVSKGRAMKTVMSDPALLKAMLQCSQAGIFQLTL